jgi:hypothetical protein
MPISTPDDPVASSVDRAGAGSPAAPEMPSFASLRDPRRRTPIDLLVPPDSHPDHRPDRGPRPAAARPAAQVPPSAASRPPEWADLWHLAAHVTVALAGVPVRVVRWQGRCLRTLLGV